MSGEPYTSCGNLASVRDLSEIRWLGLDMPTGTVMGKPKHRSAFTTLISLVPLVVTACGDSGTCSGPLCGDDPSVATVEVTAPNTALTFLGATVQLQATARDSDGNRVTGQTFTWSSSNENAVTVNTSGLATALAVGTATITATTGGRQGSLALTVSRSVTAIAVTPAGPLALRTLRATANLTAVAADADGAVVAGVTFTWASDNQAAVRVATNGTVTAEAAGVANITASASGVTSNAVEVTVNVVDVANSGMTVSAGEDHSCAIAAGGVA